MLGLWLDDIRRVLPRGVRMLLRLLVAPKPVAHRGENLFSKSMFLARTKPREQRRREHFGGHGLVDGAVAGPPAFAGVFHKSGITPQRGMFGKRRAREVEHPARHSRAA